MPDQMSNVTVIQWGIVIGASLVAAVFDLRQRRIPNALTLPLVVTGLAYALLSEGMGGLGEALAACVLVSLPYVLLFVFAGGGAGDAKMMGAIGTWLGLRAGCVALVAVAVVGAVFGLANIVAKRQMRPGSGPHWQRFLCHDGRLRERTQGFGVAQAQRGARLFVAGSTVDNSVRSRYFHRRLYRRLWWCIHGMDEKSQK